jgi:hypothetical protein
MGTFKQQYLPVDHLESSKLARFSQPIDPSTELEKGPGASAERRWVKAMQGAKFEESRQAQVPEPKFRRQPPVEYGHGSSLL